MKKTLSLAICGILSGALYIATVDCGTCAESKEKKMIALVEKAAALIRERGENAFDEFRKKGSEWLQGDVYIFVVNMDGKNLCHPVTPELEGRDLLDLKDPDGKEFVREMVDLLKSKDAGWVEYSWMKPDATGHSRKFAYVKRTMLAETPVLVGSGIYAN
jgi:signal transduction histidine kinase